MKLALSPKNRRCVGAAPACIVLLILANSTVDASADPLLGDRAFCTNYAQNALEQYYEIKTIADCYRGDTGRWHANYDRHYDWCMGAAAQSVTLEARIRSAAIDRCRLNTGN